MGIGGDLMWTSLAYEINKLYNKKVIFYKKNEIQKLEIFCNNPCISFNPYRDNIKINLDFRIMPEMKAKYVWKTNKHTIEHRNDYFNVDTTCKKCFLYPTKNEERKITKLIRKKQIPEKFILIEPNSKKHKMDKQYPIDKWQKIVDEISKKITVVQMSIPSPENPILNNVIDISNDIENFRQACCMLNYCTIFLSYEGALMHACSIFNKKSVIIYFPIFDPILTRYDNTEVIWIRSDDHFNCFKMKDCKKCKELIKNHDENIVINKLNQVLEE